MEDMDVIGFPGDEFAGEDDEDQLYAVLAETENATTPALRARLRKQLAARHVHKSFDNKLPDDFDDDEYSLQPLPSSASAPPRPAPSSAPST